MADNELGGLVVQLEARVRDFEKNFAKASRTTDQSWSRIEARSRDGAKRLESSMTGASARLATSFSAIGRGLNAGLGALGALGVTGVAGLGLTAIIGSARKAAADLAKIGDVADRIGVTTEALQALRYASEQAGGSTEAIDSGLSKFTANLADATTKSGDLYKVLNANGVAFTDAKGKLLPTVEMVSRYAEIVKNARTPAEQLEFAIRGFGRAAGPDLVGLLKQGSAGITELTERARGIGAVLADPVIRQAQELDDKFAEIATTVGSKLKGAIVGLVVALRDLGTAMTDSIKVSVEGPAKALAQTQGEAAGIRRQIAEAAATNNRAVVGDLEKRLADAERRAAVLSDIVREGNRALGMSKPAPASADAKPADPAKPSVLPASGEGNGDKARAVLEGYEKLKQSADLRIADLQAEQKALGMTEAAAAAYRFEQDMLANATRSGATLTAAQRQELGRLAAQYGALSVEVKEATDRQAAAKAQLAELRSIAPDALKGIASDLRSGTSAAEAFANALSRVADKLIGMSIDALFMPTAPGGSMMKALGLAEGGMVRGPGTSTSDSIPARLSDGEFVVNARATARHRAALEMMNSGASLPGFAKGGGVGRAAAMAPAGNTFSIGDVHVSVQGSPGASPRENDEFAARIGARVRDELQGLVGQEIARQMRPGNMLHGARGR